MSTRRSQNIVHTQSFSMLTLAASSLARLQCNDTLLRTGAACLVRVMRTPWLAFAAAGRVLRILRCFLLHTRTLHVQWRETRTIGDKIKALKKEQPKPDSEGNKPSSPVDGEITQLESVRPCTCDGSNGFQAPDLACC